MGKDAWRLTSNRGPLSRMAKLSISERLRREVEKCGETRYRIAQETGIAQASLYRFLSHERGLSMDAIDRLAAYFNLELRKKD